MCDTLESDSKNPLYPRCKKSLTFVVNGVMPGWSDKSFTSLLMDSTRYASRGKHNAKKLLSGEEDIVSDVYLFGSNSRC